MQKSNNKNQELKNKPTETTITEIKNTLEGINSRISEAEEQISELEDKMVEITSEEQNKVRRMKRTEDSLRDLWDTIKQYIRKTLTDIKGEIYSNIIRVGDFNIPLTPMYRSSKQKVNEEIQVLNDTLDEMPLIDIFRTFHLNAEYTFFSSAHGTFSRMDYCLGHKSSISKFKKIEIVSSIFSDHNVMRLGFNYKKKTVRNTNTWRLTIHF